MKLESENILNVNNLLYNLKKEIYNKEIREVNINNNINNIKEIIEFDRKELINNKKVIINNKKYEISYNYNIKRNFDNKLYFIINLKCILEIVELFEYINNNNLNNYKINFELYNEFGFYNEMFIKEIK